MVGSSLPIPAAHSGELYRFAQRRFLFFCVFCRPTLDHNCPSVWAMIATVRDERCELRTRRRDRKQRLIRVKRGPATPRTGQGQGTSETRQDRCSAEDFSVVPGAAAS